MPQFSNSFSGNILKDKLSKEELIRTIRFSISAEFEAIQIYEQISESTTNIEAKKVLEELADDEKVHVGNLYKLLEILSPDEIQKYSDGVNETCEILDKK